MNRRKFNLLLILTPIILAALIILPVSFAQRRPEVGGKSKQEKASEDSSTPGKAEKQVARLPRAFPQNMRPTPVWGKAAGFAVTPPLSEIEPKRTPNQSMRRGKAEANKERPEKRISPALSGYADSDTAIYRAKVGETNIEPKIPGTLANFEGLSNLDNAADPVINGLVFPPDTVGDVGPTQYVQATNLLFRVFNKTGTALTPPRPISFLFTALGGRCANTDDGDPIVLYDSFANRWIITQFAVSGAAPLSQCFAISQTGDATGAYYTYEFVMPNNKFNDYPKFGAWPDGYYLSNNQFNLAGTAFLGVGVFALDRAKLLAGDPSAGFIYFDLETATANARGMLPSDADGLIPPPAGAPNVFSYYNANEFAGDMGDSLRLFNFHADFAVPANSTFIERSDSPLAVAAFDPTEPTGLDDIEQPPPATATSALDAIQDRLMNRLQYRNYGGHEALTVTHTVNVGASGTTLATHQAGVRYYELRRTLPAGTWTVREQATFAPDTENRWMGSAAMDHQGNLAVGYSISSTTLFPGIRYAGRLAADPLGGLFQGEATLIAGAGVQTNTGSRWGDYSALNVDPTDDCTFFYTQEYYATTDTTPNDTPFGVAWQTRIGSFKVNPACVAPAQGTLQVNVTNCVTGLPLVGATIRVDSNLYGTTLAGGSFSTKLIPGSYSVSAAAPTYLTATANGVVITNGNTTTLNLCIDPTPVIEPDGSALTAESCSPATDAIDPGETVTVNLSVENNGSADTSNLVGTLLATDGVTSPSGPQTYGVVFAGGASVTKSFTFTADPGLACGDIIVATLQLQDGGSNLGTITYNLQTGALSAPRPAVNYSSGNIATPLPDNTTVDIPINVTDAGAVNDINVRFRMNHTFDGDVEIRLVHPDGSVVLLSDNRGGSGQNFGTGANDCSGTPTVFDDSAAVAISSGAAPFAGSFRPEQPLSTLNGKPTLGTWKLRVTDNANGDTGTIGCVTLEISRRIYLCCPFAGGTADIDSAPPAVLLAESCTPNNAPDPDETVTMDFPMQNVGTAPTTNLVATLQPGGGVFAPSGPQNYGSLSPVGPPVSRPFTFTVSGSCGGTITATFQLQDGATNLGTASFTITIGSTASTTSPFSNATAITILDAPRAGGIAPAAPYPSTINVAGLTGTVTKVTATLTNFSHTFPNDVDILLVGPAGQRLLLISDSGGTTPGVTNVSPTFDDTGAAVPSPLVTGTFRPTNSGTGDTFPAPAPAGPYPDPQLLSVFNGVNPNGIWSLYVVDDAGTDAGSISGGWSLNITTTVPACCVTTVKTTATSVTSSQNPSNVGDSVTFTATVAASDSTTPTGTVQFKDNGTNMGAPVPLAGGTAQRTTSTLTVGTHAITAEYSGAATYAASTGTLPGGQVVNGPTQVGPGDVLISEFRLSGPGGATDEFIELYNKTGTTITVGASDASAGWGIVASDGVVRCVVPNGTNIPNRGHYLCVNSNGYSLASYPAGNDGVSATTATGDATYTTDIPVNAGIALFNNATPANFTLANQIDAVGSASEANTLYKEGTGYPALTSFTTEYSFYRKLETGFPSDTNNNVTDFVFVNTDGTSAGAGQRLGAPGPENLSSPLQRNDTIKLSLVDTGCAGSGVPTSACARSRDLATDPSNASTFGTLSIRRKVTNNTGAALTRLRFRVVDITTLLASGTADVRFRTSTTFTANLSGGGTTSIQGITLEQPPPLANNFGGGYNSSGSVGTITLGSPLPTGASINIHFLIGVQQTGSFRFLLNVEALP